MVTIEHGNVLAAQADALVNTVNCVGFMGKGIALQFKKAYPANFTAYQKACRANQVRPGHMLIFETGALLGTKHIINFPTKRHWRNNSLYEDIESGLRALVNDVKQLGIKSIAIPPLGCGLGGLDWSKVRPMIEKAFSQVSDVNVHIFEPSGAPATAEMPIGTKRPHLTVARSLFVKLIEQYASMSYRLTLLEIQKLAYFLQEAGQELKLKYDAGTYGPYAPNLNKVLEVLEGHYIRGYGDTQKPDVEIALLPGATEEATSFLQSYAEEHARLEKVTSLIDGFETPYGMELLSSVHWLAVHAQNPATDSVAAIERLAAWNERKRTMFKPEHVRVAWERLVEEKWIKDLTANVEQAE